MRNRLRDVRLRKGLKQEQLAVACKTSQQQIQRIEAGTQSVKLDLAMRIASTLETTVTSLFPDTAAIFEKLKDRRATEDSHFRLQMIRRWFARWTGRELMSILCDGQLNSG